MKLLQLIVKRLTSRRDPLIRIREQQGREEFFYNAFRALSFNGIKGDYAEFGCYGGKTFALAYLEAKRHKHNSKLWAFDSFQGLPAPKDAKDSHQKWIEGKLSTTLERFHKLCASHRIPKDAYNVIAGFYNETLPAMTNLDEPNNIALAYIDCDLYSSTKVVLQFLIPRLKHGMIIAFDDYFCWSIDQISGERMAFLELFSNNTKWVFLPYIQFGWHGMSFVVEAKSLTSQIAK